MVLWVVSFEPLLKLGVGTAFAVEYDYAYLAGGIEPRFKTSFGSYLALAPLERVLLQLSGMLGSPLGALIAAGIVSPWLPTANVVCWVIFWLTVLMNIVALSAEIAGLRHLGRVRLPGASSAMAVVEIRAWLRTAHR
ncbi:MAG: hypothetical protein ACRETD_11595 [Steroidobacteraceae bacterium]